MPAFFRVAETERPKLTLFIDDQPVEALEGDTVLSALLGAGANLRHTEWSGAMRAGYCLMGACQDCLVWTASAAKIRACQAPAKAGMRLYTKAPEAAWPSL